MTAKSFAILRKKRRDPIAVVSPRDFHATYVGPADAHQILQRANITLYCLDEAEQSALFVETPPEVDLTSEAFYYQAQYRHARRLYKIPYQALDAAIRDSRPHVPHLVLLYSVGRCGSTLLTKMFHQVPGCVALSEPDVFTQMLELGLPERELIRRMKTVTRLVTGSPSASPPSGLVVLKFRSMAVEHAAWMHAAFPDSTVLFLYRNAETHVQSAMRAFCSAGSELWWLDQFARWAPLRPLARRVVKRRYRSLCCLFPQAANFTSAEIARMGAVGVAALIWLSAMHRCATLRESEIPALAIRYEDLVASPEQFMTNLFQRIGIPTEGIRHAMQASGEDSQRNSPLARSKQRHWKMNERARTILQHVLERHPFINRADFQLPDTLGLTPEASRPLSENKGSPDASRWEESRTIPNAA
jgi:hypothetical protein